MSKVNRLIVLDAVKLVIEKKKKHTFVRFVLCCGGSGEIRTRDQRIKSPLLYRLSYRPSKHKIIAIILACPWKPAGRWF